MFFYFFCKQRVIAEPMGLYSSEKIPTGPGMVLTIFLRGGTPPPLKKYIKINSLPWIFYFFVYKETVMGTQRTTWVKFYKFKFLCKWQATWVKFLRIKIFVYTANNLGWIFMNLNFSEYSITLRKILCSRSDFLLPLRAKPLVARGNL